jgi:very-short-patch-repair endonuclease
MRHLLPRAGEGKVPFSLWEKVPEGRMRAARDCGRETAWYHLSMSYTPREHIRRARALRRQSVPSEARLWRRLRDRRLAGFKFVRQEPVGPFVTDFVCREAKLVVEVDGATHSTDQEIAQDRRREDYLRSQGYRLVRIHNDDVYRRLDDVLNTILAAIEGRL